MKQNIVKKSTSNTYESVKLIKTLLVFISYLLYSNVISVVLSTFKITNATMLSFLADLIFLICIVFAYRDNLKKDFENLKKDYKISSIIKTIIIWVVIIFVFNILMGAITEMIYPNMATDDNTNAMSTLFKTSMSYSLFKTMIFAVVAEELLYRESISDVVKNKYIFIVISSIVYTIMNFIFVGFESDIIVMDILSYFLPALLFSTAYVKNNNNIIILMLIKFTYNLIPTIIYLLQLYN